MLELNLLELLIIGTSIFVALVRYIGYYMVKELTPLVDKTKLGQPCSTFKAETAIVVGGSWTGILTAKMLLTFYEKVIVLESEDFDVKDMNYQRKNVLQIPHVHAIQPCSFTTLKILFPNILDLYQKHGALLSNLAKQIMVFDGHKLINYYLPSTYPEHLTALTATRTILENVARFALLREERVTYITNAKAKELKVAENTVRGVVYYDSKADQEILVEGTLVVDCTGRAQKGLQWLKKMNYPVPHVQSYNPFTYYSSAMFKLKEGLNVDTSKSLMVLTADTIKQQKWLLFSIQTSPKEYVVTFMTVGDKHPTIPVPTSDAEISSFVKKISFPEIGTEWLSKLQRVSSYTKTKIGKSLYVEYHPQHVPLGFFASGDAICCLNPIYGQGLGAGAMSVATLDRALRESQGNLEIASRTYHRLYHLRIDFPWLISRASDYDYENVTPIEGESKTNWKFRMFRMFLFKWSALAMKDEWACNLYLSAVTGMLEPYKMLHPKLLWKMWTTKHTTKKLD